MKVDFSNVKYLIFDLDNTIILDEEEDIDTYKEVLKNLNYDINDYHKIYDAVDEYELSVSEEELYFTKQGLLDFLNKTLDRNYSIELINGLCEIIGKKWIRKVLLDEEIVRYLAGKYKLYIYTNFFGDAQYERIKNIGYDKYFEKIFGSEEYGLKPYKKSIEKVLNEINCTADECIMIGDSKNKEILAASNVGMKAILFDYDGKRDKKNIELDNYIRVKDLKELIEIL